jgi:N-acetylmuramoyl-L-alanine amidase
MRRALVVSVVLAVAVVPVLATGASGTPSGTVVATRSAVDRASLPTLVGPTPVSSEGGRAVPVYPRWWPYGTSKPSQPWRAGWPKPVWFTPTRPGALSGVRIGLDPGHDIGNSRHIPLINARYWVGLTKTCNTTGTATNAGYAEATFTFDVVARLRRLLVANGANVIVTRDRNTTDTYGPCVGARGALGAQEHLDFMVSVHGDGAPSSGRGFHVIAPARYVGYTDDIYVASRALATQMITGLKAGGLTPTTYLAGPLSVRKDVGSFNTANVPSISVETLNMRNAADARLASSAAGRQKIAAALYAGILRYVRAR